ncbi:hypothetical protein CRG98_048096 [Punica granatum]|uniref:Uncharacterized protein n=1 Tax=Punica granatum TaxID=22663 RepID=A0A2I0HIJ7_PUNGR|nr:hypothetical protein CRG98_048096 [Punica granatum]
MTGKHPSRWLKLYCTRDGTVKEKDSFAKQDEPAYLCPSLFADVAGRRGVSPRCRTRPHAEEWLLLLQRREEEEKAEKPAAVPLMAA